MAITWEDRSLPHGPYYVSYTRPSGSSLFMGITEGVIRHEVTYSGIPIRGTMWGDSVIDEIYAGQQHFLSINFKEWMEPAPSAQGRTLDVFNPFELTQDKFGETGVIGRSKWKLAGGLVLTAVANSPAYEVGPITRTYYKIIIATDFSLLTTFGVAERNVPVTFRVLPQAESNSMTSSKLQYFVDTHP